MLHQRLLTRLSCHTEMPRRQIVGQESTVFENAAWQKFPSAYLHFANLHDGLRIRVVRNVGHDLGPMFGHGGAKYFQ